MDTVKTLQEYQVGLYQPITLTGAAAKAVEDLMAKQDLEGYALRVFIKGGGCSGYQYGMALENRIREEDSVFENHGVKVVVDEMSIQYIHGSNIDLISATKVGISLRKSLSVSAASRKLINFSSIR